MKKQKKEITLRDIETMYGNEGTRVAELQSRLALVPEWLSVFLNEQEKKGFKPKECLMEQQTIN